MTREYRADEFIYFVEEPTGEFEETGAKGDSKRKRPVTKKILIDYDKIDSLDLEMRGEQVPFTHKHVVNTPLYMLYYWSPIIGDRACWLYIQLLTYCREDRDFLWDKLGELEYRTTMSRPTLNKYLDVLEEHNFIIKIHRLNKKDQNRQTTPIIKVRQSVPLLSLEQYNKLSESGKEHHDKFMERYGKHSNMDETAYNVQETIGELLEGGKVKVTQKMKKKVDKLLREENAINYIATKLEFSDELKQKELHELLRDNQNYYSKPMHDTWLPDAFMFHNKKRRVFEVVVSEVAKMTFDQNPVHEKKWMDIANELYGFEKGMYQDIEFYTYEEYMLRLESGF